MTLSLILLGLVVLVAAALVLSPLLRGAGQPSEPDPDAQERARLSAERDRLYTQLAALDEDTPEASARRPGLERRAALALRALDALPPAAAPDTGRTRRLAWVGVVLAALLTGVGAVTFVPRWQLASLDARESQNVLAVLRLPALKAAAERTGSNADYLAWGKAAFDSGNYDQAVTAYGNALKLNPRQPEALRRLGILILTRGEGSGQAPTQEDATQAALLIRTAAQLAPNEPESQLLLGFALARFGQDQDALTALERYRTLDPKGRDADDLITAIRARQNDSDPALSTFAASCASCHGPAGGGGLGPNLRQSTLTREAMKAVIEHGRGAMPAFPELSGTRLSGLLTLLEKWQKEGQ